MTAPDPLPLEARLAAWNRLWTLLLAPDSSEARPTADTTIGDVEEGEDEEGPA